MLFISLALIIAIVTVSASKSWMVNLKDEVTDEHMNTVEGWIVARGGSVSDKMNHQDIKLLVAEMDQSIHELLKDPNVSTFVDSIEEDDDLDHMDL